MRRDILEHISSKLPSKRFLIIIGGSAVIVLVFFFITSHFGAGGSFNTKNLVSSEGTVSDVVSRDSNNNGIPDWEETLYGLDPKGDGAANKAVIAQKKSAANISVAADSQAQPESETDKFSQQLLATILALRQSGSLTPEAVTNLAASLGDSVDAQHANANTYALADMKMTADTDSTKKTYKTKLKSLIDGYANVDLGSELSIIATGVSDGGKDTLADLDPLSDAYTNLGHQIIAIPTPPSAAQDALDLANASAEMGTTLKSIEGFYDNVIVGMVAIDDYTKASKASDIAVARLSAYFGQ